MHKTLQHILLLEPYYGGSHKAFLDGLQQQMNFRFTLLSLPARKWKMRMQLSAPWFAERIIEMLDQGVAFDGILTSTFVDVAVLRSLLTAQEVHLPLAIYFHENQLSYPGRFSNSGMLQFASINFTSALCADHLAFNSNYNLETFLKGIRFVLQKSTDMELRHLEKQIQQKSVVLYPGLDFQQIDSLMAKKLAEEQIGEKAKENGPVLVWNHRWEHDKDPETFFSTLFDLKKEYSFKLIVLGQHFRDQPKIFSKAQAILADRILHFGYAENQEEYFYWLTQGDFIVSTAVHEFFGISVLEGVRAGCRPVVPDRLSYKELFPHEYRYPEGTLKEYLCSVFATPNRFTRADARRLTEFYSWSVVKKRYQEWLQFD